MQYFGNFKFLLFQIRIDFITFVIAGPTTLTATLAYEIGGSISYLAASAGVIVTAASNCLTDTFTLTGPAGSTPPVICGTNTNQHGSSLLFWVSVSQPFKGRGAADNKIAGKPSIFTKQYVYYCDLLSEVALQDWLRNSIWEPLHKVT